MIIVIAVIAILAAIAIPSFFGAIDQAHASACTSNRHNIELMFAIEAVQDSDLDLKDYLNTVPAKFHCPTGGTYGADENGHVICSEHTKGASVPEQPSEPVPPITAALDFDKNRNDYKNTVTDADGNQIEVDPGTYDGWAHHAIGDYVIDPDDGVIYECIQDYTGVNSWSPKPSTNPDSWRVVGTVNGKAMEVNGYTEYTFKPGTTVKLGDTCYMYAPVNVDDFNHVGYPSRGPNNSTDWIDVTNTTDSKLVKPTKDTVLYKAFSTYNKGDVVWQHGRLYRATDDIQYSGALSPASDGATGWELVE